MLGDPFFAAAAGALVPVRAERPHAEAAPPAPRPWRRPEMASRPTRRDANGPRLPSMLDDIPAPPRLRIYANKPPNSIRLPGPPPDSFRFTDPHD
jgi:hypothetical protein